MYHDYYYNTYLFLRKQIYDIIMSTKMNSSSTDESLKRLSVILLLTTNGFFQRPVYDDALHSAPDSHRQEVLLAEFLVPV